MVVNDRTISSRLLVPRWSTTTGALMSASSIRRRLLHRGLRARVPLYRIPHTANHRWLRLQWAHGHKAWQADLHQIVFSDESRFDLWNHDGCFRVRRYASERCLPDCIIDRHSSLTPGVMVRPHAAKTVRDFCSAQRMQLHTWPAYSPDMSPIEHVGDLVGRRFPHDTRPAASKDEVLLRIQTIWNCFPQEDIQNLFDSIP
ncbi:transposable element Tcb2 transposase [Trichonephila clavipes]|nr:transposable element Tcb2 transposase [Trichonephila clavipes]